MDSSPSQKYLLYSFFDGREALLAPPTSHKHVRLHLMEEVLSKRQV